MTTLIEWLMHAHNRNDNIAFIIKARLKNKSKLSKIFIIQKSLDELNFTKNNTDLPVELYNAKSIIALKLTNYLKGITNGH